MPLQFLPEESLHSIEKSEILPSIFFEGIVRTVTHILEEGVSGGVYPPAVPASEAGPQSMVQSAADTSPAATPAPSQDTTQLVRLQSGRREEQQADGRGK